MVTPSLPQTTVVFLIKDSQILLGYKKRGLGQGLYLGIGGKVEAGETIEAAAHREVEEEIGVTDLKLKHVADVTFLFPHRPAWAQKVRAYVCFEWQGTPQESDEIKPEWFEQSGLPLTSMWDDAHYWLPAILNNQKVVGSMSFGTDLKVKHVELDIMNV